MLAIVGLIVLAVTILALFGVIHIAMNVVIILLIVGLLLVVFGGGLARLRR